MNNLTKPLPECSPTSNTSCWDEEAKRLNEEFSNLMMPVVALMFVLMIIGIFGNTVVLIVYLHRNHRTTANIFIMYLAGTDLMACVAIHPYVIYKLFRNYDQTWTGACKMFEFAIHASLAISGLTLLAIAIDRYLAICRPVKFLDFHKHIYKFIIASFTLGILGSTPLLVFYGSKPEAILVKDYFFIQYKCEYTAEYTGAAMTGYSAFVCASFLLEVIVMTVLYKQVAVVAYRSRRRVNPLEEKCDVVSSGSIRPVPLKSHTSSDTSKRQMTKQTLLSSPISIKLNICPEGIQKPINTTSANEARNEIHPAKQLQAQEVSRSHPKINVIDLFVSRDNSHYRKIDVSGHNPQMNNCANTQVPTGKVKTTNICAFTSEPRIQRLNRTKNLTSGLKAAKLLFLVTAVYFLSWLPFFILRIIHTVDSQSWHNRSLARQVIEHFLNHCFYLNNSVNPIIYSIINKQFRLECWKLLRKVCATNSVR